jgi:hypothetical protein
VSATVGEILDDGDGATTGGGTIGLHSDGEQQVRRDMFQTLSLYPVGRGSNKRRGVTVKKKGRGGLFRHVQTREQAVEAVVEYLKKEHISLDDWENYFYTQSVTEDS